MYPERLHKVIQNKDTFPPPFIIVLLSIQAATIRKGLLCDEHSTWPL